MDSSPQELELTPELLEYAQAVAEKESKRLCAKHHDYESVAQTALLHLISKPPKFDPTRETNEKTLIYTVVHYAVIKAATREARQARHFSQFPEPADGEGPAENQIIDEKQEGRTKTQQMLDDIYECVDSDETRMMLRVLIECDNNISEAARQLKLSEGTIRYRLDLVRSKLRAAGFDFFPTGDDA